MRPHIHKRSGDPAVVDGVVTVNLDGGEVFIVKLNGPVILDVVRMAVGGGGLKVPFAGGVIFGVTHTEVDLQVCDKMVGNKHTEDTRASRQDRTVNNAVVGAERQAVINCSTRRRLRVNPEGSTAELMRRR